MTDKSVIQRPHLLSYIFPPLEDKVLVRHSPKHELSNQYTEHSLLLAGRTPIRSGRFYPYISCTMAEPRPAQDEADEAAAALPKNAEDRRAAAAMSSLETRGSADDSPAPTQSVDQERLGKAMASLGETKAASGAQAKPEVKKRVKVEKKDVDLLVDELLLSKTQATKLLTKHDGDAEKAVIAYVRGEDTIA